jgi:sarcosine dehydrogenase
MQPTPGRLLSPLAGVRIGAIATRHQLFITHPIPGVKTHHTITPVIDCNVYISPADSGLMLGGYESNPVQFDMATLRAGFGMEDLPLDFSVLRRLADQISDQFPIFREVTVKVHRVACRR